MKLQFLRSSLSILLVVLAVFIFTNTTLAKNSARNAAMGGAGVASGGYDTASGWNPALLTQFDDDDDFALVLPAFNVEGSDEFEVLDTLDDVSNDIDQLEQQIDNLDPFGALATKDLVLNALNEIDQRPVRLDSGAQISVAVPGKTLGMAFEARGRVDLFVFADYVPTDEALIDTAIFTNNSSLLDNLQSNALAFGVGITEVAVSLAHEFSAGPFSLGVGVTPKYQTVETYFYNATVRNYDEDDFDADQYSRDDSNLNLDVGLVLAISDTLTAGLQLRDMIEQDYDTAIVNGFSSQYTVEPHATAGVAWRGSLITLAYDMDLTETQPFDEIDGSRFARLGAELDVFGWLQLRAGTRVDLSNTREDIFTAGIGISPFGTFHLDLTGATGDKDTYGAALDIRWTF